MLGLKRDWRSKPDAKRRTVLGVYWAGAVFGLVFGVAGFAWLEFRDRLWRPEAAPLRAIPSDVLTAAIGQNGVPFEQAVIESIRDRGFVTVTVHVSLADRKLDHLSPVDDKFGDGDDPSRNQYWGALFGVETYLLNKAGWRRAFTDSGDGVRIVRRVVFHRKAETSEAWRKRGVAEPFDVYVLANAWRSSRISEAMVQPLRDALSGESMTLTVDGRRLTFGGGSSVVGYVGQNAMMAGYWDPFVGLSAVPADAQVGLFYLCWKSAVYLHRSIVERGLYPVLFVRQEVVPEGYLLDGLLRSLISGELDDGFLNSAASEYAKNQPTVSFDHARAMFFR